MIIKYNNNNMNLYKSGIMLNIEHKIKTKTQKIQIQKQNIKNEKYNMPKTIIKQ